MNNADPPLSVDLLRRIDAACDRFEEAWRGGFGPQIEDYLDLFKPEEKSSVLTELQSLQQELILSRGTDSASKKTTVESNSIDAASDPRLAGTLCIQPREIGESDRHKVQAKVTFRVIAGPHAGLGFTFEEHNTLFAGRLASAQLRLEKDLHFSRHHFRLEVNPPTCFLMDLHSRNGTFVNGERVNDRFLRDGDVVSGGKTKMVVSVFAPTAAPAGPAREAPKQASPKPLPAAPRSPVAAPSPQSVVKPNSATPHGDPSSTTIAGYQIFEQIGAGDLGIVYRAQKLTTQEQCALKILTPAANTDETSIATFLREASILNQLQHPHIIRLIEMGASGQHVFLATEFVESISWAHLVSRYSAEKRIRVACALMSQILGALEYAHARSLVHRDVKPGNLLIVKKDNKLLAKLSDFGLAKQYTTAGMSQVTRDGDVLGSLPFMSPDQFLNSREARPTCDIYSAGATLYWLLAGHEPIPLEGHPCKFLAILEDAPTPIRQHNAAIPEALAQIVHRSLEKTAEKRFTSAAEMKQQLRAFLK